MNIAFMVGMEPFCRRGRREYLAEVVNAIRMAHPAEPHALVWVGRLLPDQRIPCWPAMRMNLFGSEDPWHKARKAFAINDQMPVFAFRFLQSQYNGTYRGKSTVTWGEITRDDGDTRFTPRRVSTNSSR